MLYMSVMFFEQMWTDKLLIFGCRYVCHAIYIFHEYSLINLPYKKILAITQCGMLEHLIQASVENSLCSPSGFLKSCLIIS